MSFPMNLRVCLPKHVLVRTFENESVLLNLDSESYHGLDDVGTRIWEALTTSESIQAAYEKLQDEFEVEASRLQQDLDDFLTQMVQRGLLEVHEK